MIKYSVSYYMKRKARKFFRPSKSETGANRLSLIKYVFFIICIMELIACQSRQSKDAAENRGGDSDIQLQIKKGVTEDFLTVRRSGDTLNWLCDTLAIVSWWDAKGKEYSQAVAPGNGWIFKRKSIDQGYSLSCRHPRLGFSFPVIFILEKDVLTVSVPSSGILETGESRIRSLRLLPRFGASKEGEKGYLVIPGDVGILCEFHGKNPSEQKMPVYVHFNNCNMPFFGIVRDKSGIAAIVTNGQFNTRFCLSTNWGDKHQYAIDPEFTLRSFVKEEDTDILIPVN